MVSTQETNVQHNTTLPPMKSSDTTRDHHSPDGLQDLQESSSKHSSSVLANGAKRLHIEGATEPLSSYVTHAMSGKEPGYNDVCRAERLCYRCIAMVVCDGSIGGLLFSEHLACGL